MDDQPPAGDPTDLEDDLSSSDSFRINVLSTLLPSPQMRAVAGQIRHFAAHRIPVLICGESGVGKEIVARALHRQSPWAGAPWVPINCGAIPAGLIETELFGHEKGAFSGASSAKPGLIESADGGTIFLDEIGELPLDLQSKLLRFLDDREIRRVGATSSRTVDARVIAATNRDLVADVRQGRFRQDLFFRLRGTSIHVPPLRERLSDIPILSQLLLDRARGERNMGYARLSIDALSALVANPWPGNVRELKHAMEIIAITVAGPDVTLEDIPESVLTVTDLVPEAPSPRPRKRPVRGERSTKRAFMPLAEELALIEKTRMIQALEASGWIQMQAARLLKVPRRTFVTKMKRYGIRRP